VIHVHNSSIQDAEIRGLQVRVEPGLHDKTMSQNKEKSLYILHITYIVHFYYVYVFSVWACWGTGLCIANTTNNIWSSGVQTTFFKNKRWGFHQLSSMQVIETMKTKILHAKILKPTKGEFMIAVRVGNQKS
jgi:hypothetical protein